MPAPPPNPHLPPPGTPGNGGPHVDTRLPAPQQIPSANPPGSGPSWWDVPGQIEQAIDTWLGDLAQTALTPILSLFGAALLASPDVTHGRIAELWQANLVLADTFYVLLVIVGGIFVMSHETVQTRYGIKQIAPRVVFGFLAANLSLQVIGQLNSAVTALATAIWGQQLNPTGIGNRLLQTILAAAILPDGATQIFLVLLALVICALAVAVLLSCMLRTAGLMVLAALAPLPLTTHGRRRTSPCHAGSRRSRARTPAGLAAEERRRRRRGPRSWRWARIRRGRVRPAPRCGPDPRRPGRPRGAAGR
jgi:hypothetical protein